MFPELEESDGEELPNFGGLLSQQPHEIQPLENDRVVVLCNSDSESSFISSPAWKKPRGAQDSTGAALGGNVVVQLSSESEEEEIIPLAERLRKKLSATEPSLPDSLFTRIQERSPQDLTGGDKGSSTLEKAATDGFLQQPLLPRAPVTQRRAAPGTWELSDSDEDLVLCQPPVCVSDCAVQSVTRRVTEISLKHFPSQTQTKQGQEEFEIASRAALHRKKEREAQKVLQEQERERRKVLGNLRKAQRPEECLKHIQVVLDPGLLQVEGSGQVLTTLQALECSCVIESQVVPFSITWRRKSGFSQIEDDLTEEPSILVLVPLENFIAMIRNNKQESMEGPIETLQHFVANIMKKIPGKTLALAVVGLEKYFSSRKHKSQKKLHQRGQRGDESQEQAKWPNPRGKANSIPDLSRVEVEEALVDLQLCTSVQVRILESWTELSDFVRMFTKAVAEAPFKRERDKASFSFCLEGDWIGGTKVDRSGKGLIQVWKKQIQQFSRVSLEIANAIVARYPSPLLLMQAYETCCSEQGRQNLLTEIPVRRGDGVTASTRRVGPDLSKRIYLQMTSHNPDLSLDVTG